MIEFNVNNDQVFKFTARLQEMHRSDFPLAVRGTLNDLAFDTKKKTLEQEFKQKFIRRNKSFLRSQSGVQKAEGWDVSTMQSEVGIIPKAQGGEAAKGLTEQEYGGSKKKPLVYMKQARGGSNKKLVQSGKYFNKYQTIRGDHANVKRHSRKSNFVAAAIMAHRLGKLLIWKGPKGDTVFLINSIYLGAKNAVHINSTPIADYEKNRLIKIQARPFLRPASEMSLRKSDQFFIANAKRRFERSKK